MSFTFYDTIPNAPDNPSDDQPLMKQNNISAKGILAVDHITFDASNGGTHLQVHLPGFTAPAVVNGSATQGSVVYSKAGVADAAYAQLSFKNAHNFDMPLNLIKAYRTCDVTGVPINLQTINVSSVTLVGSTYKVVINANVLGSGDYAVYTTTDQAYVSAFLNTMPTTFDLQFFDGDKNPQTPNKFSFFVMQL